MQTKTYFASSVPAALELARKELGEDAMLVTSKPSSPEARPFGRLEVTFAFDSRSAVASLPIPPAPPRAKSFAATLEKLTRVEQSADAPVLPRSAGAAFQRLAEASNAPAPVPPANRAVPESRQLASEMDEIRQQLSALKRAVTGGRNLEARSPVAQHLIESGMGMDLAEDIASAPRLRSGSGEVPALVARELAERIPVGAFP
jgi:flagellar biosynthesis GTPase FlhF